MPLCVAYCTRVDVVQLTPLTIQAEAELELIRPP